MTARQRRVLAVIAAYQRRYRVAPTYRELAAAVRAPLATVYDDVRALRASGRVAHLPRKARGLSVSSRQRSVA